MGGHGDPVIALHDLARGTGSWPPWTGLDGLDGLGLVGAPGSSTGPARCQRPREDDNSQRHPPRCPSSTT
jgi:hypothetical protein